MRIRSAVLHAAPIERPYRDTQPLKVVELELDPPGPGEVLVRIEAAGLCHSDLSVVDGNRIRPVPMALGHEAAGVIAAISPRMRWSANVVLADAICGGETVQGVFGANLAKAARILAGERPLDVLGGDKVRAFYRAIQGDPNAVVLDVWMMRAAGWTKATLSTKEYESLATALLAAASREGIDPADFQAVVWTHVRGGGE